MQTVLRILDLTCAVVRQPKSMKLAFKGDKKSKSSSSKRHRSASPSAEGESSTSGTKRKSSKKSRAVEEEEEEEGEAGDWVFPQAANEVSGPTFIWSPTDPPCCISVCLEPSPSPAILAY